MEGVGVNEWELDPEEDVDDLLNGRKRERPVRGGLVDDGVRRGGVHLLLFETTAGRAALCVIGDEATLDIGEESLLGVEVLEELEDAELEEAVDTSLCNTREAGKWLSSSSGS